MHNMASPALIARERVRAADRTRRELEDQLAAAAVSLGAAGPGAPLVDADGYPRADVDLLAVTAARRRVVMLRNDVRAATEEVASALEALHALGPAALAQPVAPMPRGDGAAVTTTAATATAALSAPHGAPFAVVDDVTAGSPAAAAGLRVGDRVASFGGVGRGAAPASLAFLADEVRRCEGTPLEVVVLRPAGDGNEVCVLSLTPQRWGGPGLLGCHVSQVLG